MSQNSNQKQQPQKEEGQKQPRKRASMSRVPLGTPRSRMDVDDATMEKIRREGKVARWINDDGEGRLQKAVRAGYEFYKATGEEVVGEHDGNTDIGSHISIQVGTRKDGQPMLAYLMVIPREFYDEDQAAKQAYVDQMDAAISRGDAAPSTEPEKEYIPEQGITYKP